MICPICHKKSANRVVTRRFNGVVVSGEVCDDCYEDAFSLDQTGFCYTFLQSRDKACRFCGRKLSEIEETLMVGCQKCYEEFSKELSPLINKLQGLYDED